MKNFYKLMLLVVLAFFYSTSLHAAEEWEIDKTHSRFGFEARHIFASVYGYFQDYEGIVNFDPDAPENSSMSFTIEVESIQTMVAKRDNHLRSGDFFEVKKYPKITFVSSSVTRISDGRYDVTGTLTIKDVSEDIVLPFTLFEPVDNPLDPEKRVAGFEARLELDRLHYHVGDGKYARMGAVGKDVQVVVSLELLKDK